MKAPLHATLAYAHESTRESLRASSRELGILFEREIDLSKAVFELTDQSLLFIEDDGETGALSVRVRSIVGSSPDLLVVVLLPARSAETDRLVFDAGAFDVIELGPQMVTQLARTVAAANRILALQDERSRLSSELAHQDKLAAMGLLAAGVGHEVNNPCAAILSNVSSVRDQLEGILSRPRFQRVTALEDVASDWLEALGDCVGAARRIHAIVKTLNVFSTRSDAAPPVSVDINEEINVVLRLVGKEVRFRANFDVSYDPEMPPITAPPNAMTQILTNLVVNALQAVDSKPPADRRISIVTGFDETHAMVSVTDNGVGIPEEILGRIFDPFFTTKRVGEGTGLGLSIVRSLVQKCGGEIFVESAVGEGTTFRMIFERRVEDRPVRKTKTSIPPAHDRLRVLILDDDELTLRSLKRSLSTQFECIVLTDARSALASLRNDSAIDVVLSDVIMPEMNGLEFYRELEGEFPELALRTAFVSGGITSDALRSEVTATGRPCLSKPADLQELIQTIRTLGGVTLQQF